LALAQAVIYLACAAKSNAVYTAYNAARAFVSGDTTRPVPLRLRNAPTRLMKDLGYGKEYRYAHEEEGAYAAGEDYFPDGMPKVSWYAPTDRGLEGKIREKLEYLRTLDREKRGNS
jgi:putative ATPase